MNFLPHVAQRRYLTAFVFCVLFFAGCAQSPTGRNRILMYSSEAVNLMGDKDFVQIKDSLDVSSDYEKISYLTCVAETVIKALPAQYNVDDWEIVLFDSDERNAFALPGGHIGFFSGMLDFMENQDQVATVVGHELAHVLAEHANESISQQIVGNLVVSTIAFGLSLGTNLSDEWIKTVAGLSGLALQVGLLLPYSRTHEREADQLGLIYMAQAGFDPREGEKLWKSMSEKGPSIPAFLSTHPAPDSRSETLKKQSLELLPLYTMAQEAGRKPQCDDQALETDILDIPDVPLRRPRAGN